MTNFDTATGLFLFEWLLHKQLGLKETGNGLSIDMELCIEGLDRLAQEIEELERIIDDECYKQAVKLYVRQYLPEGEEGRRFSLPTAYARLVMGSIEQVSMVDFYDLQY